MVTPVLDACIPTEDDPPLPVGDTYTIQRTWADLPPGDAATKVWMTAKTDPTGADPGVWQKVITTSDVPGTGQITDDGGSSGSVAFRVDIAKADSRLLTPATEIHYDMQVLTGAGHLITLEIGTFRTVMDVTKAES
jgi:hypothetical protein